MRQSWMKCLITGLLLTAFVTSFVQGSQRFPRWKLTKVTTLGEVAPSAAATGLVTVFGVTAGYTDKANKKTYPVFVAKKSAVKAIHIYVDFVCTQTTKLGWVGIASGPILIPMSSETLYSVTKNVVTRFELTLEGYELSVVLPGLYDIYVTVVPNVNGLSPSLTGNGGMSTATVRMRLDS